MRSSTIPRHLSNLFRRQASTSSYKPVSSRAPPSSTPLSRKGPRLVKEDVASDSGENKAGAFGGGMKARRSALDDARPTGAQMGFHTLGIVFSAVAATYAVLFYDFGEKDHCFIPVRQWYAEQKQKFFTLSDRDRKVLEASRSSKGSTEGVAVPVVPTTTNER